MKIGRKILCVRLWKEPTTNVFSRQNGLSPQHLKQIGKWLGGIKMSRKIVCLCWLLVDRVIPVNGWRKIAPIGMTSSRVRYGHIARHLRQAVNPPPFRWPLV